MCLTQDYNCNVGTKTTDVHAYPQRMTAHNVILAVWEGHA